MKHLTASLLVNTQRELLADWVHPRETGSVTPRTLIGRTASTQFKRALLTKQTLTHEKCVVKMHMHYKAGYFHTKHFNLRCLITENISVEMMRQMWA